MPGPSPTYDLASLTNDRITDVLHRVCPGRRGATTLIKSAQGLKGCRMTVIDQRTAIQLPLLHTAEWDAQACDTQTA